MPHNYKKVLKPLSADVNNDLSLGHLISPACWMGTAGKAAGTHFYLPVPEG